MNNEGFKKQKRKRLFKNVHGLKRFLLLSGIYLGIFLIFFIVSADITSRPSFCPTCHYMESFHQSWQTSSHNKVDCIECHMEPGIEGTIKGKINGLVMVVNYVTKSYKNRKPWAEIPDNACNREGCHVTQAFNDSTYDFKGIPFSHKNHLGEQRRGKTLKCTSCHSQIVQGTHIQVTDATCFNCHLKKQNETKPVNEKLASCNTCHDWSKVSKVNMKDFRYDHTTVNEKKTECDKCHNNVVSGEGKVEKDRCYQCHFEKDKLEKITEVDSMHKSHITDNNVPCSFCHSQIQHKIQKVNSIESPSCNKCHSSEYNLQANLYSGEGGFNVEKTPSIMFENGIDCKGCHDINETNHKLTAIPKSYSKTCDGCHETGFGNLVTQWKKAEKNHLEVLNTIYKTSSFYVNQAGGNKKEEALKLLEKSNYNINMVKQGKSVHNIKYSEKLLVACYAMMKKALSLSVSERKLPVYKESSLLVPNQCYNCHTGVEEISVSKYGMQFSHKTHVEKVNVSCSKCHSNDKKHGEMILNKDNCNSCHHVSAKEDEGCRKCHSLQTQIFTGNYLNKSQPDIMKSNGVKCIDCHMKSMKIVKPSLDICKKCHDNSYKEMALDWAKDYKKQFADAETLLKNIISSELSNEQKIKLSEAKKFIYENKPFPGIFVHNYDLLSSHLSEITRDLKENKNQAGF